MVNISTMQGEVSDTGSSSLGVNEVKSTQGQDLVQFEELFSQETECPTGRDPPMRATTCHLGVSEGQQICFTDQPFKVKLRSLSCTQLLLNKPQTHDKSHNSSIFRGTLFLLLLLFLDM